MSLQYLWRMISLNKELEDILQHFGTKGMKWGVRKQKDEINSQERTIKKGTTIQNISSRQLDMSKGRHMYGSYTKYDKEAYTDMMGNFMYNGKGYKNEFVVKKDIKLPNDKELVDTFVKIAKENPKQVSKDMSKAYNDCVIFFEKSPKHFEKKINKIKDADTKRGEKLAKQYISVMVSDKAAKSRAEFMGALIKKGFDGMSDVNDRDTNAGTQDPLIIFKPQSSLGKGKSMPLDKEELDKYYKKFLFEQETRKERFDLSEVQHKGVKSMKPELQDILQHHGVKGMKWGKVKAHVDSIKREHSLAKTARNADNMSTKDIQKIGARAQLENDMKRLSKKVGNQKEKADYLKRGDMADHEILRKVQRLRAKDNLNRVASDATKTQREVAKKVMQVAGTIGLHYALTGKVDKKVVTGAIIGAAVQAGGEKARMMKDLHDQSKKIKNQQNNTKHGIEDEETLQHHGVKGMHWGQHKKVKQMIKNHQAKQNKRVLEAHDKLMEKNHKTYKKLYEHHSKRYKTHLGAAKKSMRDLKQIQRSKAQAVAGAALLAAPHLAPHIGKAARAVGKAAQDPANIRRAKNVVQAIKNSPIRYVDGKAMKNVIN